MLDFNFYTNPPRLIKGRVAFIPANIASEACLMNIFSESLDFPDYFGRNWDALWDCLGDFSWLSDYSVVIVHADLPPLSGIEEQEIYLKILRDTVREWQQLKGLCDANRESRNSELHSVTVYFPLAVKKTVVDILAGIPPRPELR